MFRKVDSYPFDPYPILTVAPLPKSARARRKEIKAALKVSVGFMLAVGVLSLAAGYISYFL